MIKGCLFDMDGVMIKTMRHHFDTWNIIFREYGKPLTWKEFTPLIGKTDIAIAEHFSKTRKIILPKNLRFKKKAMYKVVLKHRVKLFPGVKTLVESLSHHKKVLVTSTEWHEFISLVLHKFNMRKYFRGIIGKQDVKNHKPHPEIYKKAVKKLGLKPKECVVFEDSIAGVTAAKKAGCYCIGVTNNFPKAKLEKAGADLVVSSFKNRKKIYDFISSIE